MGTVERDRIEYVGAEGARAMFDFTSDTRRTRQPHEPGTGNRTNRRTEPGEKAKAGRGHKRAGHSRPPRPCARLVCPGVCPVCGISSTTRPRIGSWAIAGSRCARDRES